MCGVVGIYNNKEASTMAYLCLYALQHRGQEGVGIATYDDSIEDPFGNVHASKGLGLVSEVFASREKLESLEGRFAVGHNRYSTHGEKSRINIQPLVFNYKGNRIIIAHNGNLVDLDPIRGDLEEKGALFQTSSDTEYIIQLFSHSKAETIEEKMLDALRRVNGAYSLVIMYNDKMIIARDQYGFRPLCLGRYKDTVIVTSETCALDLVGAEYERDIAPGEMVIFDGKNEKSYKIHDPKPRHCIFEYVYFSRPDSRIFGEYVDKTRRKIGKILALEKPVEDADIVISVPDSSNTTA
ncbi:MAG: class II glutamine amidotransferase, partial [Candidatus Marinimicrobia bacterium]|nr:class II glutamine amidotransferase [Candidatus Neomarinimicrobiota bacterium]